MSPVQRALLPAALMVAAQLPAAVIPYRADTFEDGTTMGWRIGMATGPGQPANVATGGPAGADDNYLQLTALGGAGQGSKLSALNDSANWSGSFAGIGAIVMDVNNFGPDQVELRLLFEDFEGPGPPVNLALSTEAVVVAAGSGWQRVVFPIDPGALTAALGTAEGALASTDVIRIFHNPQPFFMGPGGNSIPSVTATLGVDNLAAVPEPGTLALLGLGLAGLAARRRWFSVRGERSRAIR